MKTRVGLARSNGQGSGNAARFMQRDVATDSLLRPAAMQHMRDRGIDAWVTFHNPPHVLNPAAVQLIRAGHVENLTALFVVVVYADPSRKPVLMVSKLEEDHYDYFRRYGNVIAINKMQERNAVIKRATRECKTIAVEYMPGMLMGGASIMPAAMLEWLKEMSGAEIVSSGDLLQAQICVLTPEGLASHIRAANLLTAHVNEAFNFIGQQIRAGVRVDEYDVQQFLVAKFEAANLQWQDSVYPPLVAVRENAANPHYGPEKDGTNLKEIQRGDLVLIDFWAREKDPNAIYADLGWMAYVGTKLPKKYARAFETLVRARDAAFEKMQDLFRKGRALIPHLIDGAARRVILDAGYPNYPHGTGHSITTLMHGEGVPLGTRSSAKGADSRMVTPGSLVSDEPGIYIKGKWGMRIEADIYIDPESGPRPTCEIQHKMYLIE